MLNEFIPSGLKPLTGYLLVLFILGLVLSSFAFAYSYFVSGMKGGDVASSRQISVRGEGRVAVRPDTAVFDVTVTTQSKKVGDAQNENSQRSNTVLDYLKRHGIGEKDLKTIGYFVEPQYQYNQPCVSAICPLQVRPPEIVSYTVRNTLEVKVRDLAKVDDLLSGVVAAGANEVSSVTFKVDNDEAVQADARKKAIDDARAKAEILAEQLGVHLTKIISFSESGAGVPIYYSAMSKGGGMAESAPAPHVEPGQQEVQSNVNITYEFR